MSDNEQPKNFIQSLAIGRWQFGFKNKLYTFDYPMGESLEDVAEAFGYLDLEVKIALKAKKEKEAEKPVEPKVENP
jgi:hypothetical protein